VEKAAGVAPAVAETGGEFLYDAECRLLAVSLFEPNVAEQRGDVRKLLRTEELGDLRLGIRP
jgi:hypothetical protein